MAPGIDHFRSHAMSIFDSIKRAIFGRAAEARPAAPTPSAPKPASPAATNKPAAAPATAPAAAAPMAEVDVEGVLVGLAAKNPQKLNWQSSIVDLMKLLSLDSSLENRKALAKELGYTGDSSDSATMNVWLHKQVMRKLAENGGKVPASLRD
jgi:3-oxoacyl-ACP reductase-like protein